MGILSDPKQYISEKKKFTYMEAPRCPPSRSLTATSEQGKEHKMENLMGQEKKITH